MTYYKIIAGQEVFNNGTSLKINGRLVSNPTPEMYAQEGWLPYTPPPVIPSPQEEPDYEQVVNAVKKMLSTEAEELTDEEALNVAALYPTWHSRLEAGQECKAGDRLWYDEDLWKVIQTHMPQLAWNPRDAVSLFTKVSIEEWPEWVQPTGAQDVYMAGAKVTHNSKHWISAVDNNSWEPGVYGWNEV